MGILSTKLTTEEAGQFRRKIWSLGAFQPQHCVGIRGSESLVLRPILDMCVCMCVSLCACVWCVCGVCVCECAAPRPPAGTLHKRGLMAAYLQQMSCEHMSPCWLLGTSPLRSSGGIRIHMTQSGPRRDPGRGWLYIQVCPPGQSSLRFQDSRQNKRLVLSLTHIHRGSS